MNDKTHLRLLAVLGLWLVSMGVLAGEPGVSPAHAPDEGTVVFLVRHAEKAAAAGGETPPDPGLTKAGRERAEALARILSPSGITAIHSTDFRRTRQTAGPTADALDVEIEIYGPDDLDTFAEVLRERTGRHLVVGHSNTTPRLVERLGGEPGEPIDESREYDRLYILVITPEGTVTTVRQRYFSR